MASQPSLSADGIRPRYYGTRCMGRRLRRPKAGKPAASGTRNKKGSAQNTSASPMKPSITGNVSE